MPLTRERGRNGSGVLNGHSMDGSTRHVHVARLRPTGRRVLEEHEGTVAAGNRGESAAQPGLCCSNGTQRRLVGTSRLITISRRSSRTSFEVINNLPDSHAGAVLSSVFPRDGYLAQGGQGR